LIGRMETLRRPVVGGLGVDEANFFPSRPEAEVSDGYHSDNV